MQNRIWLLPVVTETRDPRKPRQKRCPKSVLTALTCDYLTARVILAATPIVKAAVLPSPASPCLTG